MKRFIALCVLGLLCVQLSFAQTAVNENASGTQEPTTNKIKVFPNPATNVVNILGLANSSRADITISDMYGNVVLKYQWEIRNHALNVLISEIPSGIYMIRIRSQEQSVETKFFKQ